MTRLMLLAPALLGACATPQTANTPAGAPVAIEAEEIRYATTPCYGTCPVYAVTIRPDGSGRFEGQQHTAVTGARDFRADPATYRRFAALLAPHRPAESEREIVPGRPGCGNAPTDMPSTEVRWQGVEGGSQTLRFYGGCGVGNEALATALRTAPSLIPIAAFVGRPAG